MSEELNSVSRKDELPCPIPNSIQSKNMTSLSLLSIVHEKNKIIEKLQKQLHFQKLQLKYYLKKNFHGDKIAKLAKTCLPQATEENLPVTIAFNNYYNQMGIKSKIITLFERMCSIDNKVSNLLQIQESFLRRVVGKICEVVRKGNDLEIQFYFKKFITNPEYIDMFNHLLRASLGLKKNLDSFRICCDRLIIIEEERNMIVDQVYSLPIEQRTNCNYLIGIQIEKIQLQNRMKEILQDQVTLRNRIEQLSTVEEQLKTMQDELKISYQSNTENVTAMLKKVNREAMNLIAKNNQQREKYTKEILQLKNENYKISKILERVKLSMNERKNDRENLKLEDVYAAGHFQALDKEITQAIQENELRKNTNLHRVKLQYRELTQKLKLVESESKYKEKELDSLRKEFDDAKRQWEHDLATVQKERDDYRAQVEDLQAIRSAYAQLVENGSDLEKSSKQQEYQEYNISNDKKMISELEQENLKLSMEISRLTEVVEKQKSKIFRMSSMIMNMNNSDQKVMEKVETKDVGSGDIFDGKKSQKTECLLCEKNSNLEKNIILQELQKSNVTENELVVLMQTNHLDDITSTILQDLSKDTKECHCQPSPHHPTNFHIELTSNHSEKNRTNLNEFSKKIEFTEKYIKSMSSYSFYDRNEVLEHISIVEPKLKGILKVGGSVNLPDEINMQKFENYQKNDNEYENYQNFSESYSLLEETHQLTTKREDNKYLHLTYKNKNDLKFTTDSDPTTNESQLSCMENIENKKKVKTFVGYSNSDEVRPFMRSLGGKIRSMSHIN